MAITIHKTYGIHGYYINKKTNEEFSFLTVDGIWVILENLQGQRFEFGKHYFYSNFTFVDYEFT